MNEDKKLCVVVPYRDREAHLSEFAPWINKTLQEQQIQDYLVLIVEQNVGKPFNRAKLLNVGFSYVENAYDYYCFHDVDMLPLKSDYTYCSNPTHLATEAEQFDWKLPYEGYFGGVTIFDKESFRRINGYSNQYWGWGAEDDDVFHRCRETGIKMSRKNCRFRSLSHERKLDDTLYRANIDRLQTFPHTYIRTENGVFFKEGLSTLDYEVLNEEVEPNNYYKKITVEI
jgi:hypothetical protein